MIVFPFEAGFYSVKQGGTAGVALVLDICLSGECFFIQARDNVNERREYHRSCLKSCLMILKLIHYTMHNKGDLIS